MRTRTFHLIVYPPTHRLLSVTKNISYSMSTIKEEIAADLEIDHAITRTNQGGEGTIAHNSETPTVNSRTAELEAELEKINEQIEQNTLDSNIERNTSGLSKTEAQENAACGGSDETSEAARGSDENNKEHGIDAKKGEENDEEEKRRQLEAQMTDEEREGKRREGQVEKNRGNELFRNQEFGEASFAYTKGLDLCPLAFEKDRAVMFANRAACKVKMEQYEDAVEDCTKALVLDSVYLKVLLRRAQCYEKLEKLEDALAEYQKVLELDRSNQVAGEACMRLPDEIKEKNEKLKEEMMGKLKDLGNMILKPFGLSTNNFQMNQDPSSGSYSVNFVQNTSSQP